MGEALVLGSWGCGAYKLDWSLVMSYFRDVIVETDALSKYREIHFPLFEKQSCGFGSKFQSIWQSMRRLRGCWRRQFEVMSSYLVENAEVSLPQILSCHAFAL